jgi:tRNA threonylcarbamoyl adenosine modification protein YeaZ
VLPAACCRFLFTAFCLLEFSMNILALETSGAEVGIAALQSVLPREADTLSGAADILLAPARPLAVLGSAQPRQLSRDIIAGIDAALHRAGWTLDDVDALAVGLGPGSWTSLRIGLSTAKTLAQTRDWRLAGVPTFDAMAQAVWRFARARHDGLSARHDGLSARHDGLSARHDGLSARHDGLSEGGELPARNGSLVDAATQVLHPSVPLPAQFVLLTLARCRPGEVYGKLFICRLDGIAAVSPEQIGAPTTLAAMALELAGQDSLALSAPMNNVGIETLAAAQEAAKISPPPTMPLVLLGDGASAVSDELTRLGVAHLSLTVPIEVLAMEVGRAGEAMLRAGSDADPLSLQPLYVAPSAAERNFKREPQA